MTDSFPNLSRATFLSVRVFHPLFGDSKRIVLNYSLLPIRSFADSKRIFFHFFSSRSPPCDISCAARSARATPVAVRWGSTCHRL
jgi:hypothetical protein